jgi:hypothetical protein
MALTAAAFTLTALATSSVRGQEKTTPLSKVERLNRAPVNKEVLRVQLPRQGDARTPDGISPGQCTDLSNPPFSQQPGGVQLGFRLPFLAISPFSKPHYVSHTVGDHTSLLAFIEKRFLSLDDEDDDGGRLHLTKRDQHANTLEDMFDFDESPSLNTPVTQALPPANDCTPQ